MQCSAWKPWVLTFTWMPLDTHYPPKRRYTPPWQWHSHMAVPHQQANTPCHTAKTAQERKVKASTWPLNSPDPQSNSEFVEHAGTIAIHEKLTVDPTWLWPLEAWTEIPWECLVESATKALAVDLLRPVRFEVASMDWTSSNPSRRCSIKLGSGEFGWPFSFLSCSWGNS